MRIFTTTILSAIFILSTAEVSLAGPGEADGATASEGDRGAQRRRRRRRRRRPPNQEEEPAAEETDADAGAPAAEPEAESSAGEARSDAEVSAQVNAAAEGEAEGGEEGMRTTGNLRRSNRMEFDARLVRGQTAGAGAVVLFNRGSRPLPPLTGERRGFTRETVRDVLGTIDRSRENREERPTRRRRRRGN